MTRSSAAELEATVALLMTSETSAQDSLFFSFQLTKQKPGEEAAGSKPQREQLYQSRQVPPALALPSSSFRGRALSRRALPPCRGRCSSLEMSSQDSSRYGQSLNLTVLGRQRLSPGETGAQRLMKGH